jgi:hypothetical protein
VARAGIGVGSRGGVDHSALWPRRSC